MSFRKISKKSGQNQTQRFETYRLGLSVKLGIPTNMVTYEMTERYVNQMENALSLDIKSGVNRCALRRGANNCPYCRQLCKNKTHYNLHVQICQQK
jgi:hypothetical protein